MRRITRDLVDHDRNTRQGTVQPSPGSKRSAGLVVVGADVLALVICVCNFALGDAHAGVAAAIVGLLAYGAGLAWIAMDRRRIRDTERRWPMNDPAR